jgi:vancomycin resistance protein YoaR
VVVSWLLLGLVLLAAGVYGALCLAAGDRVPAGTTVDGVDIGGLREAAAEERLAARLGPRARQPIPVRGGDLATTVDPDDAGLGLDVRGTVRAAGGGNIFTPARLWMYYTGAGDVEPRITIDRSRLADVVIDLAERVDKAPVDGTVTFTAGSAVPGQASVGQRLSRGGTRQAIIDAYLGLEPARLPVTPLPPVIDDDAVAQAMSSFARPATSGPLRLVLGGQEVTVSPRTYTTAITMTPDGARLKPMLDLPALVQALAPVARTMPGRPVSARIVVDHGKPRIVPSKKGVVFDRADLRRKFLAAVARAPGQRRVAIKAANARPAFTTAEARRLRVKERVATFSTRFAFADYRNTNLARGAELLDETLLEPGQTFSFNKTVGKPSVARGFAKGYLISGGEFTRDADGGLSQLATTAYNAMFFAGLKDVEHEVRTGYSPRFPKGRAVTVAYGRTDLRFTNDSPYGVLVTARVTPASRTREGTVTVSMWSTKRWDVTARTGKAFAKTMPDVRRSTVASCEAAAGDPGFSVHVTRVFRRPGRQKVMRTETRTAVYAPSDTVVCATP